MCGRGARLALGRLRVRGAPLDVRVNFSGVVEVAESRLPQFVHMGADFLLAAEVFGILPHLAEEVFVVDEGDIPRRSAGHFLQIDQC